MSPHRFEALDGLRGLFALTIALFHFAALNHVYDTSLLRSSYLFVDFFFLLSGFVIAHASRNHLANWHQARIFMLRRFGRVWPLHAATLTAFVGLEILQLAYTHFTGTTFTYAAFDPTGPRPLSAIFTNLLLIQSFHLHHGMTWNLPAWSIGTEFYTYLLFAVLAVTTRRWLGLALTAVAIFSALSLIQLVSNMDTTATFGMLRCMFGFFTGWLAYTYAYKPHRIACPHVTEALCLLLIILFPITATYSRLSLIAPLAFALPLIVFAHQQGFISRILTTKPLQKLGLWSYAIYMVHYLVLPLINIGTQLLEKLTHQPLHTSYWLTSLPTTAPVSLIFYQSAYVMDALTVLYLIIVIAIAAMASRWIESPSRRYINKLATKL